jgi:hypothetical protein
MGDGNGEGNGLPKVRALEPMGKRDRDKSPTCYRIRRVAEPTPKQPSRLLFLPPVWTRASFWLPLGRVAAPPTGETPEPDPHDDFAA